MGTVRGDHRPIGREGCPGQRVEDDRAGDRSRYEEYLEESYANYRSRLEDLEQLAVFARQFPTLEDFLTQLALLTNLEAEDEQPARTDDERLRLSTIHQAKGLEFDVVFVIMLCDGLFPSERSLETDKGEEEERRLMYVAITRARNELYLSYPLMRAGLRRQRRHDAAAVAVPGGDSQRAGGRLEPAPFQSVWPLTGSNRAVVRSPSTRPTVPI